MWNGNTAFSANTPLGDVGLLAEGDSYIGSTDGSVYGNYIEVHPDSSLITSFTVKLSIEAVKLVGAK